MSETLVRIKRAVLRGHFAFSGKARMEMDSDGLTVEDVVESIVNAVAIYKTIRTTSPMHREIREYLHIIQSTNMDGLAIYTKGKLVRERDADTFYFLISSKRAL